MNTNIDAIIKEAGDLLKKSKAGEPHTVNAWEKITWTNHISQLVDADAEAVRCGDTRINTYPSLLALPAKRAHAALLREFGNVQLANGDDETKQLWRLKYVLPEKDQITAFQGRLQDPKYETYRSIVESFHTSHDRLVALNLANALIANNVPRAGAFNVDIRKWGGTSEYATLCKYHTIASVLPAYASKQIVEDFGAAFADVVLNGKGVRETSIANALEAIVCGILNRIR